MKPLSPRKVPALVLMASTFLCAGPALGDEPSSELREERPRERVQHRPEPKATYTVQSGDTLSEIATRFGVTVDTLVRRNPTLDPDHIREGQELRLGEGRRIYHEVRTGQTLTHVARYHRVSVRDLVRWNPGLDPDHIRAGQKLVVYSERPLSLSLSVGLPYRGHLENGVLLPRHQAYVIRRRKYAYGTRETIDWMLQAFDAVRKTFPKSPRVRVHDISDENGGWLFGHNSHQSGRDVDISYYQRVCPRGECAFGRIRPEHLDVARQWTLVKHWLARGRVQAIFMDYTLQKPLYDYAKAQGATHEELHRWFQYPRGRTFPLGIVRHYPKHQDHFHVRFVCPENDSDCR